MEGQKGAGAEGWGMRGQVDEGGAEAGWGGVGQEDLANARMDGWMDGWINK